MCISAKLVVSWTRKGKKEKKGNSPALKGGGKLFASQHCEGGWVKKEIFKPQPLLHNMLLQTSPFIFFAFLFLLWYCYNPQNSILHMQEKPSVICNNFKRCTKKKLENLNF